MCKKRFACWIIPLFIAISYVGMSSPIFADDCQTTTVSVNFIRKIMPESLPGNPNNVDISKNNSDKKIEIARQMPKTNDIENITAPVIGEIIISMTLFYIVIRRRKINEKYI